LISGLLLAGLCPYLISKLAIFDPLDEGIILNEAATIMNDSFHFRNWEGVRVTNEKLKRAYTIDESVDSTQEITETLTIQEVKQEVFKN